MASFSVILLLLFLYVPALAVQKIQSDEDFIKEQEAGYGVKDDAEFQKKESKSTKFKLDEDFKNEHDFKWGELGRELDVKNYKEIVKTPVGPKKKKTLIENTFYTPPKKISKPGYTLNGEINWTGMYKRINRLDDNFTPATHYTDFYFWVDSKSEDSKYKEQFFAKVGAYSENGSDYDKRKVWLDDTYGKIKIGSLDLKLGNMIETLGSGDNISFLDNLNPRRYYKGTAGDYNKTKKALPMIKTNLYMSKNLNFECHILPYFTKSELATVQGMWGSNLQLLLAGLQINKGAIIEEQRIDNDLKNSQLHFAFNGSFEGFDFRLHTFKLRDNVAIVKPNSEKYIQLLYPEYRIFGADGSVSLGGEYLLRGELAWYQNKWFTGFDGKTILPMYKSDQICGLIGIDRTFKNSLYINLQGVFTHINDFMWETAGQRYRSESGIALRVQKGYFQDKYQTEVQGFYNTRTKEYLMKSTLEWRYSDIVKYVLGFHLNEGGDKLGSISEFHESNHTFLQLKINW
ncbi:MAG TPA: hypothetical protein PKK26_02005 [Candidatus Wallbacteria bacterium]|nr:hypothetical protein [Candidatus Wallbacteria bacterium]